MQSRFSHAPGHDEDRNRLKVSATLFVICYARSRRLSFSCLSQPLASIAKRNKNPMKSTIFSILPTAAALLLIAGPADARKKKAAPPVPLTEVGEKLLAKYDAQMGALKAEIAGALPKITLPSNRLMIRYAPPSLPRIKHWRRFRRVRVKSRKVMHLSAMPKASGSAVRKRPSRRRRRD